MTEEMRKWADAKARKNWTSLHIEDQAEYWVAAFVNEVKKRAAGKCSIDNHGPIYWAFTDLTRELLDEP